MRREWLGAACDALGKYRSAVLALVALVGALGLPRLLDLTDPWALFACGLLMFLAGYAAGYGSSVARGRGETLARAEADVMGSREDEERQARERRRSREEDAEARRTRESETLDSLSPVQFDLLRRILDAESSGPGLAVEWGSADDMAARQLESDGIVTAADKFGDFGGDFYYWSLVPRWRLALRERFGREMHNNKETA